MDVSVKNKYFCKHGKQRSRCIDCNGCEICEHGKVRHNCKRCGGNGICEHNRHRSMCKECVPSLLCTHGKFKNVCKECNGALICEHGKRKSVCIECGGGSLCAHNKRRDRCRECGGSAFCMHSKVRYECKDCHGTGICKHNTYRPLCPECGGRALCKSRQPPYNTQCGISGNRKLNGFCTHCFANIFPDDPRTLNIRVKSKELKVVSHIPSKYKEVIYEQPWYVDLKGGCCETKRRIDLRNLINNTMLCIEIDEDQHKSYIKENEVARYDDLFMDFSGKYIFIRYNPDKFKDKYGKSPNPYLNSRMEVFKDAINKQIVRIQAGDHDSSLAIHHAFVDET